MAAIGSQSARNIKNLLGLGGVKAAHLVNVKASLRSFEAEQHGGRASIVESVAIPGIAVALEI